MIKMINIRTKEISYIDEKELENNCDTVRKFKIMKEVDLKEEMRTVE